MVYLNLVITLKYFMFHTKCVFFLILLDVLDAKCEQAGSSRYRGVWFVVYYDSCVYQWAFLWK